MHLDIHPLVKEAILKKQPVVALESTIISHGMPYPKNYETALLCEDTVRKNGAVPATIAIINGVLKVGLTNEEIAFIAKEGKNVIKTSRRDIPYIMSRKLHGATTVSATMIIAQMAGIKIFATGGIGGVHRGAQTTFDISADLEELASTDVCVVCAGAKAILDLGLTLEYLETKGVPVIGYKTFILPAFYSKDSNFKVNYRLDTAKEIADFIALKWNVNLKGGVLVTNPIADAHSIPHSTIDKVIVQALEEMHQLGITGKETTPYLLAKICELTDGVSLESNIQLVLANCRLAAEIAQEYMRL